MKQLFEIGLLLTLGSAYCSVFSFVIFLGRTETPWFYLFVPPMIGVGLMFISAARKDK